MTRRTDIDPQWAQPLRAEGLQSPADLLEPERLSQQSGDWALLSKPGLNGRQRWCWRGRARAPLYLKRYQRPSWREQFDRLWRQNPRHSRAWWEFRQAQVLNDAHIPAPESIAFAEEMSFLGERRSAVLLGAAPGDALDRVWDRLRAAHSPLTRGLARHDLIERLGRFISAFHQTGLCHRDLYLCHVFAEIDESGRRAPRFSLIDLARTHRPRWWRLRWLVKDLSQLDVSARQVGASRADRLRFLLAYLGLQRGAPRVRLYARKVAAKSDWIAAQIARRAARPKAQSA